MSSSLVITLAVIGGVAWLAFLGVSALRNRGKEEIAPNQAPGRSDEELETRRLERTQLGAVVFAGFLAVSLPLYFLGENQRQEGFVEQFSEESITRGEHLVEEFGCYNCHGPGGSGGVATYIERRTGVSTSWAVPSLDDIFYRYEPSEVNFWITYGRPNTPMPAWGLAGGGAMNTNQVQDIVNYLQSHQIPQQEALARVNSALATEQSRLANADATMSAALSTQAQLVAEIQAAPDLTGAARTLADEMRQVLEESATGIDTDGDELSDIAEADLNRLTAEFLALWNLPGVAPVTFDPANSQTNGRPDADVLEETVAGLEAGAANNPILTTFLGRVEATLAAGGEDGDADGISDTAEAGLGAIIGEALAAVRPDGISAALSLDPANPETSGEDDHTVAERAVSANESIALQLQVTTDNQERLLATAQAGLDNLAEAAEARLWEIDVAGVAAAAFGGNEDQAARAVYLFNGYCARCHTSGWSAGLPFTQTAGSGGFGPALFEGRPNVQFLDQESLVEFIEEGSGAQAAYGVNGIGSGRMPAFGAVLSEEDINLIAAYIRSGNMNGMETEGE